MDGWIGSLNDFGWRKGWIVCVIDNLCFFKKRGNVENFSFTLIASLLFRLLNVGGEDKGL